MARIENTIDIDGGDFGELKLWTGRGRLSFGGAEWIGAGVGDGRGMVSVDNAQIEAGDGSSYPAMEMSIALTARAVGDPWLQDPRRVKVGVGWIAQAADTGAWTALPYSYEGYVSGPRYGADGILRFNIVPRMGLVDEGDPLGWDAERGAAYEYLDSLSAGVDIRWPP